MTHVARIVHGRTARVPGDRPTDAWSKEVKIIRNRVVDVQIWQIRRFGGLSVASSGGACCCVFTIFDRLAILSRGRVPFGTAGFLDRVGAKTWWAVERHVDVLDVAAVILLLVVIVVVWINLCAFVCFDASICKVSVVVSEIPTGAGFRVCLPGLA